MSGTTATAQQIAVDWPQPPPAPVSFEDYLAWCLREDVHAEWVDGEVVLMAPANLGHQDLIGWLYRVLIRFVETRRLGRLYFSDVLMRLPTRPSGRVPDLLFVSSAHLDRLREAYVDGPADLVVEVVSPDSEARDRAEKFVEYEAAGIPEFWLIDPIRHDALFYRLGEDRMYHPSPVDEDGVYQSAVLPGFRLRVDWLWQRPLPDVDKILQEINE